jgi:hypothetical protein
MNRVTLLVLCVTLLACKDHPHDSVSKCTFWCPDFDEDGRGEFSALCEPLCLRPDEYPTDHACEPYSYVNNCDEVRPPFAE